MVPFVSNPQRRLTVPTMRTAVSFRTASMLRHCDTVQLIAPLWKSSTAFAITTPIGFLEISTDG
jgi:hypothetical protein